MKKEIPDGILILSLLNIGNGIWNIIILLFVVGWDWASGMAAASSAAYDATNYVHLAQATVLRLLLPVFICSGFIVFGSMALKLRQMGRMGLVIISLIAFVLYSVIPIVRISFLAFKFRYYKCPSFEPLLVIHLLNLWYLTRPKIKEQFK